MSNVTKKHKSFSEFISQMIYKKTFWLNLELLFKIAFNKNIIEKIIKFYLLFFKIIIFKNKETKLNNITNNEI